ncbi:MFS transporter [Achromobacter sp. 413638]|uniref:MFS transporter n=1 Tax=Achromobacter sp. 413638 TaxID=3342385 RepID=UPI00370C2F7A
MRNTIEMHPPASATLRGDDALYRKVGWRLLPFLMFCYAAAYLDRVNIGFAKLQMSSELAFSETVYGLGAGVFFIGYFLLEVPSNLMLRRLGARVWIARIMITWALISGAFCLVTTPMQFYVLRFLLGCAEAGFYPGIVVYLSQWYPPRRRSQALALFMIAIPVAGILGGPLSGWILQAFHGARGWSGWQWMFVLEAIPSLALGIMTLFYLDSRPEDARWLNNDEKARIAAGLTGAAPPNLQVSHTVGQVFRDPRVLLMAVIYFCVIMGQYGLTFWMPTLIKAAGATGPLQIGLLSAIPFAVAVVVMVCCGRSSDRSGERRWHLAVPMFAGAAGYALVAYAGGNVPLAIVGLSLAAAGAITPGPLFWALPSSFLAGEGAAAGIAAINSFAALAGFVSPYLIGWLRDLTQTSSIAMYVSGAVLVIGALLILRVPARMTV